MNSSRLEQGLTCVEGDRRRRRGVLARLGPTSRSTLRRAVNCRRLTISLATRLTGQMGSGGVGSTLSFTLLRSFSRLCHCTSCLSFAANRRTRGLIKNCARVAPNEPAVSRRERPCSSVQCPVASGYPTAVSILTTGMVATTRRRAVGCCVGATTL